MVSISEAPTVDSTNDKTFINIQGTCYLLIFLLSKKNKSKFNMHNHGKINIYHPILMFFSKSPSKPMHQVHSVFTSISI